MVNELRVVMAECEMKELRVQLLPKSATEKAHEERHELKQLQTRREELRK
jgi:hypothetical protein